MDSNALLRFVYAIATARHLNVETPKRRVVEAHIIEILVTSYVLEEARRNIGKLIARANLKRHGWSIPAREVVTRVLNELEGLIASGIVVNIESPSSSYSDALRDVLSKPERRVLLPYTAALAECMRSEARSLGVRKEEVEKDIPVAEGILLAYDVAAAVPLKSQGSIVKPPFLVVTYDETLLRLLGRCLQRLGLNDKIVLIRYPDFGRLLEEWVE